MKDLSFFLLKNSLGAKMKIKVRLRSFCNGVGSTSTLNQNKADCDSSCCMVTPSIDTSSYWDDTNLDPDRPPTLEEMILQLELEEEATSRKAKFDDFDASSSSSKRRMSCVNNSDILRSARNALNQYPRFSVDGRDAMYRSSFRNLASITGVGYKTGRTSVCCSSSGLKLRAEKLFKDGFDLDLERTPGLPQTIAGESVLWCKPGVVAKLMGLEAMPVPIATDSNHRKENSEVKYLNLSSTNIRKENLRRADQMRELGKRRLVIGTSGGCRRLGRGTAFSGSNSLSLDPMGGRSEGLGGY
ncbi:uncharacterized protein LOC122642181 [Telopea speciosissima]|uniref:uncharacterized protein LOC122642181 n=1 Tax=Telopea speciosissima TaxID=54955 RepID=UPI001CC70E9F|nr:uncharacterized protein LOC122642181 [Telopea speciosissima]